MNNELNGFKKTGPIPVVVFSYAISLLLLAGYVIFYQYAPLEGPFNNLVLNSITSIAALAVAGISTAIFLHYHEDDSPRKIWRNIMLAGWSWFLGEVAWQIYAFLFEEVPSPGLTDVGWIAGFIFFTFAFYHQYSIISPARKNIIRTYVVGLWLVALLIPAIILTLLNSFSIQSYIGFYYPVADLIVGLAGLALVFVFKGGALTRPWIGLMVFGVSDLLYAWADKAGLYAWSVDNSNTLTLVIDSTYLAAYLILAMGFLGQWILITRGLRGNKN